MWTEVAEEHRAEKKEKLRQLITFSVSEEEFAVDISQVQEVIRLPRITLVPNAPDFIEGVIHLRGRIIPVIDLRKRLRLSRSAESRSYDKFTRVLIIMYDGKLIGFVVDRVAEILKIPESAIRPTPELILEHTGAEYFEGVVREDDRLIILLNLQKVLAPVEQEELERIDMETIKRLLQEYIKGK